MSEQGALFGVDTLPPDRLRQKALSQWFTPAPLAARLVAWAGAIKVGESVLEPSAGGGAIVDAIRARQTHAVIDAVEIDPAFASKLDGRARVHVGDYLSRPAPAAPYGLCIQNPPYEDGADGRFIAKAMDESERVIALCRLNVVTGKARHERVWSRIGDEWWLVGLAFLVGRPSFSAAGVDSDSPLSDFVAIKLSRRERYDMRATQVEWWA